MDLYRARPGDGVAWITGASSGIGRQLALDLAADGFVVAASARREEELVEVAAQASARGGRIVAFACDVTDEAATRRTVEKIESELGPIVLAVFNAGTYLPTRLDRFDVDHIRKTFELNVVGAANGLVPVVQAMSRRSRGQVALVGSLTSYFGLPSAGAYGASKAALNSLAQSLKHDLDKVGIRIQVINPGFVETPLTDKNSFPMPALVSVTRASQYIRDGLRRGGFEIAFPRRLAWPMKFVRLLPQGLRHVLINRATGWNRRPAANVKPD